MRNLTAKEMEAAKQLHRLVSTTKVCEDLGIPRRTLFRLRQRPEFITYLEALRVGRQAAYEEAVQQIDQKVEYQVAAKEEIKREMDMQNLPIIKFTFEDAARGFDDIYRTTKNDFCKVKALESLMTLFGIARKTAGDGATPPAAPDVYQAEWMRKPQ